MLRNKIRMGLATTESKQRESYRKPLVEAAPTDQFSMERAKISK